MQGQLPWWVSSLVIPAFFIVLGAAVAFLSGQVKDWLQARHNRNAFLEAIGTELRSIKTNLEDAEKFAEILVVKLQVTGHAPQIIPKWGTKLFDTQLGKLRNVADKLVAETVQAYALVGQIDRIVEFVNAQSREYLSANAGNEKADAQARLKSSLMVLGEEITKAVPKLHALIQKLPSRSEDST
jgi:hypothetical protein